MDKEVMITMTGIFFSTSMACLAVAMWQKMKHNRALRAQNSEINRHNLVLEREIEARLHEITNYNKQLERYAFVTAHNLRAPVARIIGLAHLYELSQRREEELELKEKLITTVQELDQVISELNLLLDVKADKPTPPHRGGQRAGVRLSP